MENDKIEKYLQGEITERDLTNTKLTTKEIQELSALKQGLRLSNLNSKLLDLQNIEKEIEGDNSPNKNIIPLWIKQNRRKIISLAATIIILFASITFFRNSSSEIDNLYSDNYSFYPSVNGVRSDDKASQLSEALTAYNSNNFVEAISKIENIIQDNSDLLFFQGISYMELNKYKSAISSFEQYGSIYGEKIGHHPYNFYIGLCYIKLNDIINAKQHFSYVQKGTYGYENAQEILQSLKNQSD